MEPNRPEAACTGTRCMQCGRKLTNDEIGAHKKLVNRGAQSFLCKTCLAQKFRISEALIDEKIRQFREMGCSLFV